jgi:hypothetical protein
MGEAGRGHKPTSSFGQLEYNPAHYGQAQREEGRTQAFG